MNDIDKYKLLPFLVLFRLFVAKKAVCLVLNYDTFIVLDVRFSFSHGIGSLSDPLTC
jgi:hypothetical protein